jgi:hypothetical protein
MFFCIKKFNRYWSYKERLRRKFLNICFERRTSLQFLQISEDSTGGDKRKRELKYKQGKKSVKSVWGWGWSTVVEYLLECMRPLAHATKTNKLTNPACLLPKLMWVFLKHWMLCIFCWEETWEKCAWLIRVALIPSLYSQENEVHDKLLGRTEREMPALNTPGVVWHSQTQSNYWSTSIARW